MTLHSLGFRVQGLRDGIFYLDCFLLSLIFHVLNQLILGLMMFWLMFLNSLFDAISPNRQSPLVEGHHFVHFFLGVLQLLGHIHAHARPIRGVRYPVIGTYGAGRVRPLPPS